MSTGDHIATMTGRIVQALHPVRIILFGSNARGQAGPGSDVDLLVVLDSVEDKRRAAIAVRRLLVDLPVAKDIVITSPEEIAEREHLVGTVLRPALREGTVVYERE